jgi:hypothetical protein
MATATTPTLGGVSLPMPKEQTYTRLYRGGTLEMADGSIVHDLVDATVRHRFRLRWEYLSSTEKGTIQTQWDALKNATATYLSIENVSYTVTQPEVGAGLEVTPEVVAGAEIVFHVSLELLEDS